MPLKNPLPSRRSLPFKKSRVRHRKWSYYEMLFTFVFISTLAIVSLVMSELDSKPPRGAVIKIKDAATLKKVKKEEELKGVPRIQRESLKKQVEKMVEPVPVKGAGLNVAEVYQRAKEEMDLFEIDEEVLAQRGMQIYTSWKTRRDKSLFKTWSQIIVKELLQQ